MSEYTNLITTEHANSAKFILSVAASTDPFVDIQALLSDFGVDFDLDTAIGDQLDIIGKWVGVSRQVNTPLTGVYFEFDTAGVGWDEGYWKRQFDPSQGLISLLDEAYRLLLRATISLNYWDGTTQGAGVAIAILFPNNFIYIQDNMNMTMTVAVGGPTLDVVSAALLLGGYLALKPCTVRIDYVFSSLPPAPIFGFDVNNSFIGGWESGAWGQSTPAI